MIGVLTYHEVQYTGSVTSFQNEVNEVKMPVTLFQILTHQGFLHLLTYSELSLTTSLVP